MSDLASFRERLGLAREALAGAPLVGAGQAGPPDQKTGERWDRTNVLGHVAEMLPHWTSQVRAAIGGATEIGRGESGYAHRREGIDSGRSVEEAELRSRIDAGIDGLLRLLGEMGEDDLDRPVTYRTHDGEQRVDLRYVLEELLVGHTEAHVRQLQELTPG
jgi:DinB superfamily